MQKRARRGHWLRMRVIAAEVLRAGCAVESVEWCRARHGLWIPYWRGLPLVSLPMTMGETWTPS